MKPRIAAVAAVAAVLLLALTGCTSAPASPEPNYPVSESAEPVVSETVAPLVAETGEAEVDEIGSDAAYLSTVRTALEANGGSSIPTATDEQLIAAGQDACTQLLEGVDEFEVRVIEGEQPGETGYVDSLRIAGSAVMHFCPEVRAEG